MGWAGRSAVLFKSQEENSESALWERMTPLQLQLAVFTFTSFTKYYIVITEQAILSVNTSGSIAAFSLVRVITGESRRRRRRRLHRVSFLPF